MLRNGDSVEVKLDTTGNMDHMVTGFQNYAFHNSVAKQQRRRPIEVRQREEQIDKIKRREEKRLQIARSLFGEEIDLETKETMAMFASEWETIKMPSYVKSKQEIVQLEQIIKEHYVSICTAFKFYGGLGDVAKAELSMNMHNRGHNDGNETRYEDDEDDGADDDETISLSEFESFCGKTGILDGYNQPSRHCRGFHCKSENEQHGKGGVSSKWKVMSILARIIEALILLALQIRQRIRWKNNYPTS